MEHPSRLLALPAELRNAIYVYVSGDPGRIDEYGAVVYSEYVCRFTAHSLLLANRQIYHEAVELYYEPRLRPRTFASYRNARAWYGGLSTAFRNRLTSVEFLGYLCWYRSSAGVELAKTYVSLWDDGGSMEGDWVEACQNYTHLVPSDMGLGPRKRRCRKRIKVSRGEGGEWTVEVFDL